MNIGENIKKYRKNLGLTQQQFAEKIKVSFQSISSWERGDNSPGMDKLEQIAFFFKVPIGRLLLNESESGKRWELSDRMFSEEHMYTFVQNAAISKNLTQTSVCLPLVKQLHEGQVRKGKDRVPYIYHPLMLCCHALALGLDEDDIIATALLHDVVEDCDISVEDLPVNKEVQKAVSLLSFSKTPEETKDQAKNRYYQNISKNRLAVIVKVLDRCNNISSMAVAFSKEKMAEYIDETENFVMPVLDCMKHNYPECYNAAFLLKYQMLGILESLKRTI